MGKKIDALNQEKNALEAQLSEILQDLRQTKISDPSNGMAIAEFDRDHHLSVQLYSINLVLGVVALVLNGREIASKGKE